MNHQLPYIVALAISLTSLSTSTLRAQVDWSIVNRSTEAHLRPILSQRTPLAKWIGQSSIFCYHSLNAEGKRTYYLVNTETGKRELLLPSQVEFVRAYQAFSGDSSLRADSLELASLSFEGTQTRHFTFRGAKQKYYRYDRKTQQFAHAEKPTSTFEQPRTSRTKQSHPRYTIYGKGYNLYIKDSSTGETPSADL